MHIGLSAIRPATYRDAPAIKLLLEAQGRPPKLSILVNQLDLGFSGIQNQVFVYELKREILGYIIISFVPQLTVDGDMVLISGMAVDEQGRKCSAEKALEAYVSDEARKRNCERIVVLATHGCQSDALYLQQGYRDCEGLFIKELSDEKRNC